MEPISDDDSFNLMAEKYLVYKLTEIHRQALDNDIIRLSMDIRNGVHIPFGSYGGTVAKIHAEKLEPSSMYNANQIITGKNETRHLINDDMRQIIGFDGDMPNPGERIIVLKNNKHLDVLNGQQFIVQSAKYRDVLTMNAVIVNEYEIQKFKDYEEKQTKGEANTDEFMHWSAKNNPFSQELKLSTRNFLEVPQRQTKFEFKDRALADWGYAITVHKSQGSEWDKVILYDDHFGKNMSEDTRRRWLYTAFTRAAKYLIWTQE